MWRTPLGERTLKGAEWQLFRAGLDVLRDLVEMGIAFDDPDGAETEVAGFDRLEGNQKLAMLALVATALSSDDAPAPALTSVAEAAVAAVFGMIRRQTAVELETTDELTMSDEADDVSTAYYWRERLLAAYPEVEALREAALEAMSAEQPSSGVSVLPARLDGIDDEDNGRDDEGQADEEEEISFQVPEVSSRDAVDWDVLVESLADAVLWGDGDYDMDAAFLDASPARKKVLAQQLGIDEEYFLGIAPDPTEQELEEIRSVLRRICGGGDPQ